MCLVIFLNNDASWLLDTGADATLINSCVPGVIALKKQSSLRLPITIDGSPLALAGTVICDLDIAGVEIKNANIFVVNNMSPQYIQGTDSLRRLGNTLTIDWRTGTLKHSHG